MLLKDKWRSRKSSTFYYKTDSTLMCGKCPISVRFSHLCWFLCFISAYTFCKSFALFFLKYIVQPWRVLFMTRATTFQLHSLVWGINIFCRETCSLTERPQFLQLHLSLDPCSVCSSVLPRRPIFWNRQMLAGTWRAFLSPQSWENPAKNIPFVSSKPPSFSPLRHLFHVCRPPSFFFPGPLLHSRALPGPAVPSSIGPIVYSLHPDTKDIKLSDLWAGAGAWLINEALGRGRRRDGWRVREGGKGEGPGERLDRWADRRTISGPIDGDFCWAQIRGRRLVQHAQARSSVTGAIVSYAHELYVQQVTLQKKKKGFKKRKKTQQKEQFLR